MNKHTIDRKHNGFSILEVMIGIFIFTVGLLAMAALQGALTRSMADSKLRTTAVNIADRVIERQRGFTVLVDAGALHAYTDIFTADTTVPVNGVNYAVDMDVTDYYYYLVEDKFCKAGDTMADGTSCPTGATTSDYKKVEVTVSWNSDLDFRVQEGTDIAAADLGTGSITLTSVIPAIITSASARVADESESNAMAPPVSYSPGAKPDIISLALLDSKFKESLNPMPDVIRNDELVETRFDVITYSQSGGAGSEQFLRREEFSAVSCECTLRASNSSFPSRRPVVWAGDEYAGGHLIANKLYGESANNLQSSVCDSCCRDHHDGGTSDTDSTDDFYNVYGPFKASGEYLPGKAPRKGDHEHYQEDGVTVAGVGDKYLEACRLVRVDGFFRVTQDFRREDQYIFPEDFFAGTDAKIAADVKTYSDYITGAVTAYEDDVAAGYPVRPVLPCIGGPLPCVAKPTMQGDSPATIGTGEFPSWSALPFGTSPPQATQQLRSRGVYIDYLSDDLRYVLGCIQSGGDADTCQRGDVILDKTGSTNFLEILPFFDVQLTFLNRWNENPVDTPVNATNEALEDNNTHSRGEISKDNNGCSIVEAKSHRGNLGFTDTPAIDDEYGNYVTDADIKIYAGTGGLCPGTVAPRIAGRLTDSVPGTPTTTVVPGSSARCGQTSANWWCDAGGDEVTVTGYGKFEKLRYACGTGLTVSSSSALGASAFTTFILSGVSAGNSYTINIQNTPCS